METSSNILAEIKLAYKKQQLSSLELEVKVIEYAEMHRKEQLLIHSVGNHVFCPHCGDKRQLKVETDLNSVRVCKSGLCKGK